ncbi:hypothetical protein F2Q70_00043628 [Brassica cretica]|uniref:Uncharacterized protein n=1 Tax=Brassica cretica TaxID=69181 RepID=A0A8S9KFN3_BRACR|nr:hypothetical protein F2Q70_00043628 [Brassica cretica]
MEIQRDTSLELESEPLYAGVIGSLLFLGVYRRLVFLVRDGAAVIKDARSPPLWLCGGVGLLRYHGRVVTDSSEADFSSSPRMRNRVVFSVVEVSSRRRIDLVYPFFSGEETEEVFGLLIVAGFFRARFLLSSTPSQQLRAFVKFFGWCASVLFSVSLSCGISLRITLELITFGFGYNPNRIEIQTRI